MLRDTNHFADFAYRSAERKSTTDVRAISASSLEGLVDLSSVVSHC